MKYSNPKVYAKAVVGALVAYIGAVYTTAGGDVNAINWLDFNALMVAFVGFGGIFGVPNKGESPAQQVITGLQKATDNKAAAESELQQITQAATAILGNTPLGPLANAIINGRR